MTELFAEVNGIKICYEIYGKGYPLILIHGYGGRKEDWFTQTGLLSRKFNVITFDFRSAGKSEHPDEFITMQMFADDVRGVMDYLKIEQAHIVGESLGGMIAQQFALSYPERVNKLILIVSNYSGEMGDIIKKGYLDSLETQETDPIEGFWGMASFLYHRKIRREMKANPKKKFYGLWSVEDLIKKGAEKPITAQDLINQAHAFKDFNTLDRLHEIKNPTLLIAASHDRVLPNSQMYEMNKRISNSLLKIIDKGGHGISTSRAPEVSKLIIGFLED